MHKRGASTIVSRVTCSGKRDEQQNNPIIDRLFRWYAEQRFPTDRFDDLSPMPWQVRARAMSPLCHVSVPKRVVTAGATIKSDARIERRAKVAGHLDAEGDAMESAGTHAVCHVP